MPKFPPRAPVFVVAWIVGCAFCNCAGWILSALHSLNFGGYAVAFGIGVVAVILWRKQFLARQANSPSPLPSRPWGWAAERLRRRFQRFFPRAFLVLAGLAILGGLLHAPNNYDALAYRVPRLFHWLAEGRWHWIHTGFNRINTRAIGIEWVTAPLVVFTRTDRWQFFINVVPFLLLPGLVFSLLTRLGIRPRVAWHWMWLVPSGYCFLLQVGGNANDLFGAVFGLAAVDFALRARVSGRIGDLWLSILAVALLTASKASNLPLLLPCLVALLPALGLARRRLVSTLAVGVVAMLASFLPIAGLNLKHCGDWSGVAAEGAYSLKGHALLKVANNSVLLTIQNLVPPVFPFAGAWNRTIREAMPASLRTRLEQAFEPGGAHWGLGELQIEEEAGLGFGVTVLGLGGLLAGCCGRTRGRGQRAGGRKDRLPLFIVASTYAALFVFMAKSGMSGIGRLVTPYYFLCLAGVLMAPSQARVLRAAWWRWAAVGVFATAAGLTIVSPARPLWPANYVLAKLDRGVGILHRARKVYEVYAQRADVFAPARRLLPPDLKVLGFISFDDPEASIWYPLGSRRIRHVLVDEPAEKIRQRGIRYVLVKEELLPEAWEKWLEQRNARAVGTVALPLRAAAPRPYIWYLAELLSEGPEGAGSVAN